MFLLAIAPLLSCRPLKYYKSSMVVLRIQSLARNHHYHNHHKRYSFFLLIAFNFVCPKVVEYDFCAVIKFRSCNLLLERICPTIGYGPEHSTQRKCIDKNVKNYDKFTQIYTTPPQCGLPCTQIGDFQSDVTWHNVEVYT